MLKALLKIFLPAILLLSITKEPLTIPIGLLLGLIIFFVTKYSPESLIKKTDGVFEVTFTLMGTLAKADGLVCQDEVRFTQELFNELSFDKEEKAKATDCFKKGQQASSLSVLSELKKFDSITSSEKTTILDLLCQAAFSNGLLHKNENSILIKVAWILGFNKNNLQDHMTKAKSDIGSESLQADTSKA